MTIAMEIRRRCFQWQGMDDEEIEYHCNEKEFPADLEEECENWAAVIDMWERTDEFRSSLKRLGEHRKKILREKGLPENSKFMVCIRCEIPVFYDKEGNGYCNCFDERLKDASSV